MRTPRYPAQSRRCLLDVLERRQLLAAPSFSVSDTVSVPVGKTLQVPIAGDDLDGDSLTYSVSSGAGVTASFRPSTNTWIEIYTNKGTMRFQLFDDLAPNTVRKIRGLVEAGFYDGLNFHDLRNVNGYRFAVGGDPRGDGTGGPDFRFADEFHPDAVFSGTGQLAMVNGDKKDNNGSQFFITDSQARAFDFNFTIFGQLVRGGKVLDSILEQAPTIGSGPPRSPVIIQSARVIETRTDAVLQLRGDVSRMTSVTINVSDGRNVLSKPVAVKVIDDGGVNNTPPILQPIASVITAVPGERFFIQIDGFDLENDPWQIGGAILEGGEGLAYSLIDDANKRIVCEVEEGYTGAIRLKVGVRAENAVARGTIVLQPGEDTRELRIYDTQTITIAAGGRPLNGDAYTVASYPQTQLRDKLVARFTSQDLDLDESDFDARVDWGDGTVLENAKIEEIDDDVFGVFGTHTFARTGKLPLSVTIEAETGVSTTFDSNIYINEPYSIVGKTLFIRGTDGDDKVELDLTGGTIDLEINNVEQRIDRASVNFIDVQLFDGDDELDSGTDVGMPNQRIDAGPGNDKIFAGSGNDSIVGLAGNDLLVGNGGNDTINGGEGNDSIQAGSGKNLCYGETGNDRIIGSGGRDTFLGGEDSDRLYGRGGDDYLDGGSGTDRLYGEDGSDTLIGGASNDRMYGGSGDDLFYGRAGTDYLYGQGGTDRRGDDDDRDVLDGVL